MVDRRRTAGGAGVRRQAGFLRQRLLEIAVGHADLAQARARPVVFALGQHLLAVHGPATPQTYHVFLSHLHWDHIMGFPFFGPAFNPAATIVIHSGHADAETALRRQQEEISVPVPFDWLKADIEFRTLEPGREYPIGAVTVSLIERPICGLFFSSLSKYCQP